MRVDFADNEKIKGISGDGLYVPFLEDNYGFFVGKQESVCSIRLTKKQDKFVGDYEKLKFSLWYEEVHDEETAHLRIHTRVENHGKDFINRIGFHVGVDTIMKSYPQWHDTFFPTLLRCEKSYLWGYYMNTAENALAIATDGPVASYDFQYNKVADHVTGDEHCGHRILGTDILFYQNTVLPNRHPQDLKVMKSGEVYENTIYLIPVKEKSKIKEAISTVAKVPMVDAETYTKAVGERLQVRVFGGDSGTEITLTYPNGTVCEGVNAPLTEKGLYLLSVKNANGKECEANFFVRKDWNYYLQAAAENALNKPPKATTHTESFYGLFSAFLYAKHSQDTEYLKKAENAFSESMQYMFDMEQCVPLVIPERIQNISAFISLLVDLYEAAPLENLHYLEMASKFAEQLLLVQDESGAYRCNKTHYTCVIYVAKSMLELVLAERACSIPELQQKAELHFDSAKRAVDELVLHLDNIETEGEMTLEDGMISCSALQIAMFALMLPETERKPYIEAAEYMMKLHSCLEQQLIPDCRCNGASLRYWEAQYDVMIRANMINSPHGWTGWTGYAKYYLYLLTGKKEYLLSLMNLMGSCMQLIDEKGNLRWAYCSQPYVKGMGFVPDLKKEVKDGYQFVDSEEKAYRGRYAEQEYGEQYIDMISGWYRTGEQMVTGGYEFCPLIRTDGTMDWESDRQGGCCDNDVHEVFKCMEETVLGKAFVHEEEDGSLLCFGCKAWREGNGLFVEPEEGNRILVYCLRHEWKLCFTGAVISGTGIVQGKYGMECKQQWINETWEKIDKKLSKVTLRSREKLPYTTMDGVHNDLKEKSPCWWTNGFWGGMNWLMYLGTGNEEYRKTAECSEELLDVALKRYKELHHDVGFMWHLTSGANYRITGNEASCTRNLFAASLLFSRYNIDGDFIRAWNWDAYGYSIIDCLMNIPLLYWASEEISDDRFKKIAVRHMDMALRDHVRPDGSTNHIVDHELDKVGVKQILAGQGYTAESCWSRGLAWAVYGSILSYIHAGKAEYLEAAKKTADYFIEHVKATNYLPLVDFCAPAEPVYYDSTAGVCAACGMLEIAKYVSEEESRYYTEAAINILKACDEHFCDYDENTDALVLMGTERYPHNEQEMKGVHIPIIYGDFFFVEAMLKLKGNDFLIW